MTSDNQPVVIEGFNYYCVIIISKYLSYKVASGVHSLKRHYDCTWLASACLEELLMYSEKKKKKKRPELCLRGASVF